MTTLEEVKNQLDTVIQSLREMKVTLAEIKAIRPKTEDHAQTT